MAIVINKGKEYKIDIKNEEGEIYHTLVFNLEDVNFPIRAMEFVDSMQEEINKMQEKENKIKNILDINSIEHIEKNGLNSEYDAMKPIPEEIKKLYYEQNEQYNRLRVLIDNFIGKDTCQIIFGNVNSASAFASLMEGLVPEFEKMGVKMQNIQKNLYDKYAPKTLKVLK